GPAGASGSAGGNGSTGAGGSTGAAGSGGAGFITVNPVDAGAAMTNSGGMVIGPLPPDFTKTEAGGYKLGQPIAGQGVADNGVDGGACSEVLGVVRDFRGYNVPGGHPDFEHFRGDGNTGLVASTLGVDGKPVYTGKCEATAPSPGCASGQ